MTEDGEEKRLSRKKSAIKGPFIQDDSKPPRGRAKKVPADGEIKKEPDKAEENGDIPPVEGGKGTESPPAATEAPVVSSRKELKKQAKEEKKAKVAADRESRKIEKKAKVVAERESRKIEKKSKSRKNGSKGSKGKSQETEPQSSPEKNRAEKPDSGTPQGNKTSAEIIGEKREPAKSEAKETLNPERKPSSAVTQAAEPEGTSRRTDDSEHNQTEAAQGSENITERVSGLGKEDTSGEEEQFETSDLDVGKFSASDVLGENTDSRGAKAERSARGPMLVETPPEGESKKEAKERLKREKKEKKEETRREKKQKDQESLSLKAEKKRAKQKEAARRKSASSEIKRLSSTKKLSGKTGAALPASVEQEEDQEEETAEVQDERVSRFSLKKFVTAYRDRQSVMVRQAEIRRFQSALFPRVMARKWQTAITPTVESPTSEVTFPEVPTHLKIGLFYFRNFYSRRLKNDKLENALRKAKMPYSAIQYYSMITIVTILVALAGVVAISVFSLVIGTLLWYAFPALFGIVGLIALVALNSPSSLVNKRKKDIDSKLPMALAYIATMASADVPVETIMYELGKSVEYGEIAKEAKAISASSRLFGNDIVTALREESKYSPSLKFSEFLQGITSTVTSGGNLKDYFTMKAVQFQSELSTVIRANAESVGVLAESYVTVGVAFPLMLLVILGVMAALSPSGSGGLTLVLYMVVLAIIPAITFGFTFLVSSTVKEVDV